MLHGCGPGTQMLVCDGMGHGYGSVCMRTAAGGVGRYPEGTLPTLPRTTFL